MSSPEELRLQQHNMSIVPTTNEVFLIELKQLNPEQEASKTLAEDLQNFLGLPNPLEPLKPYTPETDLIEDDGMLNQMIDICDNQHNKVRSVLMDSARDAAKWIKEYFLKSPDVIVSSRKEFIRLLDDWDRDPCDLLPL